ncbi:MAG: hypothetical protein WC705_01145 [Candidatus Paceibacterota bacterium]|jgi:hypothetical protein
MKKLTLFLVLGLIFGSVLTTSAQTIDVSALQAQIKALLAQITGLQVQIDQAQGGDTTKWCHTFNTNLGIGNKNSEVISLSQALSKENIPGFVYTGGDVADFDEEMASAVSAFQQKYTSEILTPSGLKYPTGFVGKSTRAKLNSLYGCGTVVPPQQSFTGFLQARDTNIADIYMWGTHTLTVSQKVNCIKAPCPSMPNISYKVKATNDEVYQQLKKYEGNNVTIWGAYEYMNIEGGFYGVIAKSVELTGGYSESIKVLSPNGGEAWTKGTTQTIKWQDNISGGCPPGSSAYGLYCMPPAPRYYDIKLEMYAPYPASCSGDACTMMYREPYIIAKNVDTTSYNWSVGKVLDNTVSDGSYTVMVCLAGSQSQCDSSDSYFKITSDSATNKPPVISGVSGPTSLPVNYSGVWTVKAYDPENGNLNYYVVWGDEEQMYLDNTGTSASPTTKSIQQSATFSHYYSKAGVYNPTFVVNDDKGNSAKTSISVNVGGWYGVNPTGGVPQ